MKNGRYSLKERLLAILVSFFMLFQMTPEIALAADGDGTSLPTGTDTASGDDGWEETLSQKLRGAEYYTVTFLVLEDSTSETVISKLVDQDIAGYRYSCNSSNGDYGRHECRGCVQTSRNL